MKSCDEPAADAPEDRPLYEFEGFRLDAQHRELQRASGEPISLPPKAFDALLHLVERPGELLTRRDLLESIWPDVVVEENSLNQCISLLRRVLGEKSFEHRFIVTEPGRGYRFVAPVRRLGREAAGTAPHGEPLSGRAGTIGKVLPKAVDRLRAGLLLGLPVVLLLGGLLWYANRDAGPERLPSSVAVLPFVNLSPDPQDGYFAAGMHTELISRLAKVRGLNVIAETSMRRYAGSEQPIREIANELGVETVMEGSVRYADARVRVTAKLIDAGTGASRWSEVYDRGLSDVFEIQADIAVSIAAALETEFSVEERALLSRPPTASPEAYALYLQARPMLPDLGTRDALITRAIELDPGFADAYALRAENYANSIVNSYSQYASPEFAAVDRRAEELAAKALELDPSSTLAYRALRLTHRYHWRWTQAFETYERGLEIDSSFVEGNWLYSFVGNHARAIELSRGVLMRNPNDPVAHWQLGLTLLWARRPDEAIALFRNAISLRPDHPVPHLLLARAHIQRGDRMEALQQLRISRQLFGDGFMSMPIAVEFAYYYARAGLNEDAARLVGELERGALRGREDGIRVLAWLALGERQKALEGLEHVIERAESHVPEPGFMSLMMLKVNETADPVLELPDFAAARERLAGN